MCDEHYWELKEIERAIVAELKAKQEKELSRLEAEIERLQQIIKRMTPKLREYYTDEYILFELIQGEE